VAGRPWPSLPFLARWIHQFVVETAGDEMRVTLDGKPAAYLKSSGSGNLLEAMVI
jgi:hypothetical protein